MAAVPSSLLVAFSYADYEETRKDLAKANKVYERVLACDEIQDRTLVYVQYMKFKRRTEGLSEARKVCVCARSALSLSLRVSVGIACRACASSSLRLRSVHCSV